MAADARAHERVDERRAGQRVEPQREQRHRAAGAALVEPAAEFFDQLVGEVLPSGRQHRAAEAEAVVDGVVVVEDPHRTDGDVQHVHDGLGEHLGHGTLALPADQLVGEPVEPHQLGHLPVQLGPQTDQLLLQEVERDVAARFAPHVTTHPAAGGLCAHGAAGSVRRYSAASDVV